METVRKINDDLAIAGQIALDQFKQLAQAGYQSVLNLRLPTEIGFLSSEQQHAEYWGLYYVNLPMQLHRMQEGTSQALNQINHLPKPILIHCDTAMRSAALALIYISMRQGATLEQAYQHAEELGVLGLLQD